MPPPLFRLASCRNFVKRSLNLRWNSVRSHVYTTCSDGWSSDTNSLCDPVGNVGKFKAIESFDPLKRECERKSALLFVHRLKESGVKHGFETSMTFLGSYCNNRDSGMRGILYSSLTDVMKNMNWESVSFKISYGLTEEEVIEAVDAFVKFYATSGRFGEAINTLSEMKSRSGAMVPTETCNYLLNELIECDKLDMVDSAYRQLKRNGLIPDEYTYAILIDTRRIWGCVKEAWEFFAQIEESGVKPNAYIYGKYIHGLCAKGKTYLANHVLRSVRESNKPVDVFAYTCVIQGFVKEMRLQDALGVLHDMKEREVDPDKDCYGALICGYCEDGDILMALHLCNEMLSSGIQNDNVIMRSLMQCLSDLGMLKEALYLFQKFMQCGVFLDGDSFSIAINVACKLGEMDYAIWTLVEEMKVREIKLDVVHYTTLMNAYGVFGTLEWNEQGIE